MRFCKLVSAAIIILISSNVNAALVERLDGLAYYDTEADLTWLADANYAASLGINGGFSVDTVGMEDWWGANAWPSSLDINGVTGWRLPSTLIADGSRPCYEGYCSNTELGNLFYNVLGNEWNSLTNTGPFVNVQSASYWLANDDPQYDEWYFYMGTGYQNTIHPSNLAYVWLVRDGDVAALSSVPVPAAAWLFASGLLGLIGFARRKKA